MDIHIELLEKLHSKDLCDLCDATEATMLDTHGFSMGLKQWSPPLRHELESYFNGVMLVPERKLFVGRVDNTIAGSLQVVTPHLSNQTSNFAVSIDNHFVAPWARNIKLARQLLEHAEKYAKEKKFQVITLSVRENREAAIALYEKCNYKRWGYLSHYEMNGQNIVGGYFYAKTL
ncbi:MAG: GNAT family N-acetyltransferase [Rickettsiales bacterium]|nr:GNAT family N-acetyltransferase [Rickettsiales bacterium]